MIKKISLLLLLLASFLSVHAQSFDLTNGRVPLASLDGLWRFHTGDDPSWADPNFDDSQWPLLRSDEDWFEQGYKGYSGIAWYRFQVSTPADLASISIMLPRVQTCYQVYANGQLIGAYGKMPPNSTSYSGGLYQVYKLPANGDSGKPIEIALRVWHSPRSAAYIGGGPASAGGLIGESSQIEGKRAALRAQAFWINVAAEFLAVLQSLAGLGAVALFLFRRKEPEYLWFGLAMLFNSAENWLDLSILTQAWPSNIWNGIWEAIHFGAWVAVPLFYWRLLSARRSWLLDISLAVLAGNLLVQEFGRFSSFSQHAWALSLIEFLSGLPITVWILTILISKAREGSPDARLLLLPQIPYSTLFLISNTAWITYQLGWQHSFTGDVPLTNTPFHIELQNIADALFPLAVLAILVLRFTRTRSEEERYAGEVQAARNVQQYLIPEHLPNTPGLSIESEYRPAKEVGGDFFQVLPDAASGSVLIIVGDVAGHGMEAGMLATLIVGAIRTAAEFTTEPGNILELLNKRMQGRGLATCLALRVEKDGCAALANAGHLPPYLNGQELAMEGALPLGAIAGIEFPALHFKLSERDTLMLMTDGVAEAQNADGQLFGFDRIGEMLRNGMAATALANAAQAFGQEDDITVLTVARGAAPASA
jgi:phosphoserine phosphatase RsbU/P